MMEPIYFCFKEALLGTNNKFMLNFSNTELVYQITFSPKNDFYITTMSCNCIIANNYGKVTQNIKDLSEKSQLLLEKGPSYQFKLAFVYLLLYYPGLNEKTELLDFLSYKKIWIFSVININFTMS